MVASLPWTRWLAPPFALVSVTVAAGFWPDRRDSSALFWFAVAGALGYAALAMLLNSTQIAADETSITVRHRPVPWPGARLRRSSIQRIEVSPESSADMTTTTTWALAAVTHDGQRRVLVWGPMSGHRWQRLRDAAEALARVLDA